MDQMPTPTTAAAHRPARPGTRRVAMVAAGLLLATTVGCGGSADEDSANTAADELAEQIAESGGGKDTDVDIDSESGQIDVTTEDGEMSFGDQTELPGDFPVDDVPLPDGAQLTSAMSSGSGDSAGWTVIGDLPDATDSTYDELVALFTGAGWTTTSDSSSATGGGTASTAMLDNGTWQVVLSVQVGVEGTPDSFSYLVTPVAG
jgi:hypothetical protein